MEVCDDYYIHVNCKLTCTSAMLFLMIGRNCEKIICRDEHELGME